MDSGDGFCGWFKDRQGSAMINFNDQLQEVC